MNDDSNTLKLNKTDQITIYNNNFNKEDVKLYFIKN